MPPLPDPSADSLPWDRVQGYPKTVLILSQARTPILHQRSLSTPSSSHMKEDMSYSLLCPQNNSVCFHLSTSLRVSGASFHHRELSTALWTSLMTLEMCPFHHQNHPPLPLLTAHLGVSGQPPPSAWPPKIHHPHVASQLFPNHSLGRPTPHHLQPLLLSPQRSAGYLGPFVFTSVQATTSTTSPCLPRGTPSQASPHLCSVPMWVQAWKNSTHQQNMEPEHNKFSN